MNWRTEIGTDHPIPCTVVDVLRLRAGVPHAVGGVSVLFRQLATGVLPEPLDGAVLVNLGLHDLAS